MVHLVLVQALRAEAAAVPVKHEHVLVVRRAEHVVLVTLINRARVVGKHTKLLFTRSGNDVGWACQLQEINIGHDRAERFHKLRFALKK